MAVKCSCGRKARPGQRTCKACHAAKMKAYRQDQAERTVIGYVDPLLFRSFSRPGGIGLMGVYSAVQSDNINQPVKIILCKSPKKQ